MCALLLLSFFILSRFSQCLSMIVPHWFLSSTIDSVVVGLLVIVAIFFYHPVCNSPYLNRMYPCEPPACTAALSFVNK